AELLKAFLLTLPSEASGKLSLEVSGYRVKIPAKDVEVNDVTRKFTPVVDGTGTYETDGFHVVSIKGAVIDEGKSFAGFADNDYALSIDSLIPQNVVATEINGIYSVTFNAPVSNTAKSPKFGVKAYELAIYKDGVLASTQKVDNDPAAPITEIQIPELARDTLSFHLYTVDGKIYEGHTEVFIALKDKDGNLVEDFTVSNLAPLMDMGSMSHSTPIGKVEKVEGQPLYKTWIAGLMDGDWELAFGYVIEGTPGKITGAAFAVTPNPEGVKWIQSFGTRLYASIAYPQSYTDEGAQVLQAYINRNEVGTEPYQIVEGGYKIVVTPNFGATTLPVDTLLWNAEKGIYEGNSVTFTEEGLWTLYFKVLDAATNELITGGGSDGTESNRFWKINVVDGSGAGIRQITGGSEVKVYPTLTQGDVTVEVPADATVNVFAINGERLQSHNAKAAAPLTLNISRKGLYLINIQTVTGEVVTRKVIVK
ncbi:MAG: T9SS type A sorting domain-containing protein, partial [Dysgonamonadaceae bacterium]|nr:T9SS type A sorting domain-containing protein [Dysgonamonadaceae bacterium]